MTDEEVFRKLVLEPTPTVRLSTEEMCDVYGLALMMIREGCADPVGVARDALAKVRNG